MEKRHHRVRKALKNHSAGAMLVTDPFNITYLTGFRGLSPHEREAVALVTSEEVLLFVPRMYAEQAEALVAVKKKQVRLDIDTERDGLLLMAKRHLPENERLVVEAMNLKYSEFNLLKKEFSIPLLPDVEGIIAGVRQVKDENELTCIRNLVKKTDAVFNELVAHLRKIDYTTYTELDIADLLRKIGRTHGLMEFAFEPIVACGTGSSQPHYRTGLHSLQRNTVLLMDFGFTHDGYHSDLTRTVVLGKASDRVRAMYKLVLECNRESIRRCKPGTSTGDLQQQASAIFAYHNLEDHFIHGLGHGVGLEVHEEPYFRISRKTLLRPGMIVTIEPGLYFPGEFGIRVEDYIQIGEDDAIVLSSCERELIEIS